MKINISLLFVILFLVSKAQIYTQIDAGYNFSLYNKNDEWVSEKIYENNKFNNYQRESINFNIFSGYQFSIKSGYIMKNNIQLEIGFNYFNNKKLPSYNKFNNVSYDSTNVYMGYYSYLRQEYYYTRYFSLSPNVAYIKSFKKLKISFNLGLIFQYITIYSDSIDKITSDDYYHGNFMITEQEGDIYKYNTYASYEYKPQINISIYSGINIFYQFTNKISAHLTFNLPIYSPTIVLPNKKTRTYYKYEEYQNDKLIGSKETPEETEFENANTKSLITKTINLSFGVRYTFGKREKAE